jgi:DNA-binding NtrC family response regulator
MNRQAPIADSNPVLKDVDSLQEKIDILQNEAAKILDEVRSFPNISKTALHSAYEDLESGINLNETIRHIEIRLIKRALELSGGRQNRAASLLRIKHTTLHEKIRRYRINHKEIFHFKQTQSGP